MSVYVDSMVAWGTSETWRYKSNCHMIADTEAELDAMADAIGLKRSWKQIDKGGGMSHYDLVSGKRRLAIQHGAVEITPRQLGEKTLAFRRALRATAEAGL